MDIFYPIKFLADWFTFNLLNLGSDTRLAAAIDFFIYDSIKIIILLAVIVFVVSIIRSFLPPDKIKRLLSRRHKYVGNILAALLGIITPFCSCSAVPLFLGFVQAGVPLGVTFSFLVASPMINEVALVLLLSMFGWKIALTYIGSGLLIAILAGLIIGRMKVENLVEDFVFKDTTKNIETNKQLTGRDRMVEAARYTWDIIKKVWAYVLVGLAIGAWIHGYVPIGLLASYAGADKWYAVPLAVLIGIPLYSNTAGIVPLISVLTEKGVAMGTTLAFMMAVTGLSLPEFMILKRVMKVKLIIIFAAIVGLGIIITGYLFNFLLR